MSNMVLVLNYGRMLFLLRCMPTNVSLSSSVYYSVTWRHVDVVAVKHSRFLHLLTAPDFDKEEAAELRTF